MIKVELIYDNKCPNVKDTRVQLLRAFSKVGITANWQEWLQNSPESPAYTSRYPSPTILVNGMDIDEVNQSIESGCCRVYQVENGKIVGVPPLEKITAALRRQITSTGGERETVGTSGRNWSHIWAAVPGIGVAVLPKLTCAACLPAYAGLLASMGIGINSYTEQLAPITLGAIAITLSSLVYRARKRWGYLPFVLGIIGAVSLYFGKFELESNIFMYSGIAILLAASFWNSWPRKAPSGSCGSCA